MDFIFRFVVGGLIVSLFAVLGDVLKPKTFARLFALSTFFTEPPSRSAAEVAGWP
jgi:hypothetical protein